MTMRDPGLDQAIQAAGGVAALARRIGISQPSVSNWSHVPAERVLGVERAAGQAEPEDHAAILCEVMAGLASGRLPAPAGADRKLFEQHLSPWIGRFFADLEQAEAAEFYRRVGVLGRVFVEIETEAFALPS